MASLRRTMAAGFTIGEAVTMEQAAEQGESLLLPLAEYFRDYAVFTLQNAVQEKRCRNGNPFYAMGVADGTYRVQDAAGEFLALSEARDGTLTAIKNFF